MTNVTPLLATPLPDMTVIEMSIIIALLTDGPQRRERVRCAIEDWLAQPVRAFDLEPSLSRLATRGWLLDLDEALSPTREAEAPTLLLYAGVIRMIGSVEGHDRAGAPRLQLMDKGEER